MQGYPMISIVVAIPDHPWVDSNDGAAVDIAMTIVKRGEETGRLLIVISQAKTDTPEVLVSFTEERGKIHADLTIGAALSSTGALKSNEKLSSRGVQTIGAGFIIDDDQAVSLGLGKIDGLEKHIRTYLNGKDLTDRARGFKVIDLFGLSIEEVRKRFPQVYQWIYDRVKPERDQNNRPSYKNNWWIHGEPRATFRPALLNLKRYIATVETSKHRFFVFLDGKILPDNRLVNFALEDAFYLGVLSSSTHQIWALAAGGNLEDRPVYNITRCFQTFPFPAATEDQKQQIRSIAGPLDAHRKQCQALHPTLTITDMYNVMEKLRNGETLNTKEQKIYEQGLVSILLQLHNELDVAVAAAYGWPANLTEEEILEKLVALNKERAAEEARGFIRWLRPKYQNPHGGQQTGLNVETKEVATAATLGELSEWPKNLDDQAQAVQRIIQQYQHPISATDINRQFKKATKATTAAREQQIGHLLETISSLGLLRKTEEGLFIR